MNPLNRIKRRILCSIMCIKIKEEYGNPVILVPNSWKKNHHLVHSFNSAENAVIWMHTNSISNVVVDMNRIPIINWQNTHALITFAAIPNNLKGDIIFMTAKSECIICTLIIIEYLPFCLIMEIYCFDQTGFQLNHVVKWAMFTSQFTHFFKHRLKLIAESVEKHAHAQEKWGYHYGCSQIQYWPGVITSQNCTESENSALIKWIPV